MSHIPQDDIDAVREAAHIEDIVAEHTTVRRSGSSLKALCPFHDERTPSFSINPHDKVFYCHGCQESGDVVSFVQKIENLGFAEAIQRLADRYRISITYEETQAEKRERTRRQRLLAVNAAAAAFFTTRLTHNDAARAQSFLTDRGFDVHEAADRFGCGYAPRGNSNLLRHLRQQGHSVDDVVDAGLATKSRRGTVADRFEGRLLWAIHDGYGNVIGFGARRLSDHDPIPAKFINTSETPLYKKSRVLYGLDLARKDITRTQQVVIVEGYTDVMAMHCANIPNTVATCGTAFGAEHLSALRRLVTEQGEIVFAFDGDAAGRKAAMGAYDSARGKVRRLSVLSIKNNMDPDEARQAHGEHALTDYLHQRRPLVEHVLWGTLDELPQSTPEDKAVALDALAPLLNHVDDPLVRSQYAKAVADRLDLPVDQVAKRVRLRTADRPPVSVEQPSNEGWVERKALEILVTDHHAAATFTTMSDMFTKPAALRVLDVLARALADEPPTEPWSAHVLAHAQGDDRSLIGSLITERSPAAPGRDEEYKYEMFARLEELAMRRELDSIPARRAATTDQNERDRLLDRKQQLQVILDTNQ